MQFQDDIAAGVVLVRPALQSPDYVPGVSGWAVMIDGSAEFNDVVIRGGTTVGGTGLYYNGTPGAGNLIASIAGAAGTDEFGNSYVEGLGVYGTDGDIHALGNTLTVTGNNGSMVELFTGSAAGQASVDLRPRDLVGTTWTSGSIYTQLAALNRAAIVLESPTDSAANALSSIMLQGGGPTTTDTAILMNADRVSINNNIAVFGVATTYSSWTTFTPQWNNIGTATFSRNIGWWKRIGDIYLFEIYTDASAAGSGTTNVTISNLPFDPFRAGTGAATTRQRVGAYITGVAAGTNSSVGGAFNVVANAGGAALTFDALKGPTDISMRGEQISSSFIATIQGWMRAA